MSHSAQSTDPSGVDKRYCRVRMNIVSQRERRICEERIVIKLRFT